MKTNFKNRFSALLMALILSLSISQPVLASGMTVNGGPGSTSVGDAIEALYALDGEPLMVEDLYPEEASFTCKQDARAWADAYRIFPDDLEMQDTLTREALAAVLLNYARHHDIDVSTEAAALDGDKNLPAAAEELAVDWVISEGIMPLDGKGEFDGEQSVTKSELTAAIERYQSADIQPVGVVSEGLSLIYPSKNQSTISPLCDFYVIGDIDETVSVPDNAELTVRLTNADGEVVREVSTNIKDNQAGMNVNYPELQVTGSREAFRASMMPDLVYDPNHPDSFENTWIKACYSDKHYTCVVYGGSYHQDINPVDQFGRTLGPIPEGNYTLSVTLSDGRETLASLSTRITIGVISWKAVTRFSPPSYIEAVKNYCAERGIVIFSDPYAGNWNTQNFMPSWGIDYTGEITNRWMLVDREGYIGGMTYFFDYNISKTSISYRVEMGQLAYDRVLDNRDSVTYCYYNIGEPVIKQGGKVYEGKLVQKNLDAMETVVFTRMDYSPVKSAENYISPSILNEATSVFDQHKNFTVNEGDTISLNGICKVIQPETVTYLPETESFEMGNRVAGIRYTLYDASGKYIKTMERDIPGLQREFEDGYVSTSIVEFRHNFEVDESLRGNTYRIFANPYDEFGNDIGGRLYGCTFTVPRK